MYHMLGMGRGVQVMVCYIRHVSILVVVCCESLLFSVYDITDKTFLLN